MLFVMVSGVGQGMGVLHGAGDRRRERAVWGGEFGTSHCNQLGLCCVVVRERRALPKLLRGGLFTLAGTSSGKCNASVWRLSVCLSVCSVFHTQTSTRTRPGAANARPCSVYTQTDSPGAAPDAASVCSVSCVRGPNTISLVYWRLHLNMNITRQSPTLTA